MLKLKYLVPFFLLLFIITMFIPDEGYYRYVGKVVSVQPIYNTDSTFSDVIQYVYIEKGTNERRSKEVGVNSSLNEHIKSYQYSKMFEPRYWLHPMIYFGIFFIIAMIGGIVAGDDCGHNNTCNYCPIYILCNSENKKHSKTLGWLKEEISAWYRKRKERKNDVKIKNDIY